MHAHRLRPLLMAVVLAILAVVLGAASPATAATGTGWVRLAHLSPDTGDVDVRLAPLDGDGGVVRLQNVGYGMVSAYRSLPVGDYAIAMRAAGASEASPPVVTASVRVESGTAVTVAVFGRNADLRPKVIHDSLASPSSGSARVRVVQASTAPGDVTVTAAGGSDVTVVKDAATAAVSPYTDVAAGAWRLRATQGSVDSRTTVDVTSGQVATLFVLENARGGLTIKPVLDAASVGDAPKGFVATGGGYLAHEAERQRLVAGAGAGVVAVAAGTVLLLRRRARRTAAGAR